ncbi:MAG: lipoyl(octanoyl) transferase LipB [bacterium]
METNQNTKPGMYFLDEALIEDLGRTDYESYLRLQEEAKKEVRQGGRGRVFLVEHPPTITLGYSLKGDEGRSWIKNGFEGLESRGLRVVQVDRGGKATYHGPGQLVCYLVLDLKRLKLSVKRYMGKLQEAVLCALRELDLPAELDPSYPGVWVGGAKIAAVGVRVEDRITSHGLAVNLDPDLSAFEYIVPCGIPHKPVTSVARHRAAPSRGEMALLLYRSLQEALKIKLVPAGSNEDGVTREK